MDENALFLDEKEKTKKWEFAIRNGRKFLEQLMGFLDLSTKRIEVTELCAASS